MELTYSDQYMVTTNNFKTSPYYNKKKSLVSRDLDVIEQIIIHCTAAGTPAWEDPLTCIKYDLGPNHISRSGLATATYHFYINQKGENWQLVSMGIRTANCSGQNYNSVAICINHNGFNLDEITPELYSSLVDTCCHIFDKLDWGYDFYGVEDRIHFHRDYSPKACPGKLDKKQLIYDVSERLKTWGDSL
jgi:hypothetical protein